MTRSKRDCFIWKWKVHNPYTKSLIRRKTESKSETYAEILHRPSATNQRNVYTIPKVKIEYKSDSSMKHSIYLSNVRSLLWVFVTLRLMICEQPVGGGKNLTSTRQQVNPKGCLPTMILRLNTRLKEQKQVKSNINETTGRSITWQ